MTGAQTQFPLLSQHFFSLPSLGFIWPTGFHPSPRTSSPLSSFRVSSRDSLLRRLALGRASHLRSLRFPISRQTVRLDSNFHFRRLWLIWIGRGLNWEHVDWDRTGEVVNLLSFRPGTALACVIKGDGFGGQLQGIRFSFSLFFDRFFFFNFYLQWFLVILMVCWIFFFKVYLIVCKWMV